MFSPPSRALWAWKLVSKESQRFRGHDDVFFILKRSHITSSGGVGKFVRVEEWAYHALTRRASFLYKRLSRHGQRSMHGVAASWLIARVQGSNHTRSLTRSVSPLGGNARTLKVHVEISHILQTSEEMIWWLRIIYLYWGSAFWLSIYNVLNNSWGTFMSWKVNFYLILYSFIQFLNYIYIFI